MNCQVTLGIAYVASVLHLTAFRKSCAMISAAPTKFLPLEEHTRRETNRPKAARNAFEVKSGTACQWMAFVEKHTNKHTYPLFLVLPHPLKLLI